MTASEIYEKLMSGILDGKEPLANILGLYAELCNVLNEPIEQWIDRERTGYPANESVPEYRKLTYSEVEVFSGMLTCCGRGIPPIYTPRGKWDTAAMTNHLSKCPGLVVGDAIICRAPVSWYECESKNGTGRISVVPTIGCLHGNNVGVEYRDVDITTSLHLIDTLRNGVIDRLRPLLISLGKKYALVSQQQERTQMSVINHGVINGNVTGGIQVGSQANIEIGNQSSTASGFFSRASVQKKDSTTMEETENFWMAIFKNKFAMILLAVCIIVIAMMFFFGPGRNVVNSDGLMHQSASGEIKSNTK